MNRTTKHLAGLGLGGGLLVVAVAKLGTGHPPVAPPSATAAVPVSALKPSPALAAATATPELSVNIPPLPANATNVPDEDLLKLSASVDLANALDRSIDKERWARVMPVAEKLVQGPCDCEQRNWLNHFIAMGEAARNGADEEYRQLAGLLVKLARNDKQLADDPTHSLR